MGERIPALRAYGDGSGGEYTSDPRLRRCGWGFVLQQGESLQNGMYGTLPGVRQTVPRAEITAATQALNHSVPSEGAATFEFCTDCMVLVNGWWRGKAKCMQSCNADVWEDFWNAVDAFPGAVLIRKVKAHTTQEDVEAGRISAEDKKGNEAADHNAGLGAKLHEPTFAQRREVMWADIYSWLVQTRLLAICLKANRQRPPERERPAAERSRRQGDEMPLRVSPVVEPRPAGALPGCARWEAVRQRVANKERARAQAGTAAPLPASVPTEAGVPSEDPGQVQHQTMPAPSKDAEADYDSQEGWNPWGGGLDAIPEEAEE